MDTLYERANVTILQAQLLRLEFRRVRLEYGQMRQRLRERTLDLAAVNAQVRNRVARSSPYASGDGRLAE
jgi:hypothetical protein